MRLPSLLLPLVTTLAFSAPATPAQTLSGQALVAALREGGYVIVMRHASSPREEPDERTANADNVNRERQLDDGLHREHRRPAVRARPDVPPFGHL